MTHDDSWWFMMTHDDSWWLMMIHDDSWWHMMNDTWWHVMTNDDSWWLMMNYDDSWWPMITPDDPWWPWWLMMTHNDSWWLMMNHGESCWLMMTHDGDYNSFKHLGTQTVYSAFMHSFFSFKVVASWKLVELTRTNNKSIRSFEKFLLNAPASYSIPFRTPYFLANLYSLTVPNIGGRFYTNSVLLPRPEYARHASFAKACFRHNIFP